MHDPDLLIVEGYRIYDSGVDLSSTDAFRIALEQRAFGPRQLLVVTARFDGQANGLAHCDQTEPPEAALECCLDILDDVNAGDGATAAVAYSDERVGSNAPPGLAARFAAARNAAAECGVHLVDWMMCDDTEPRSMRFTIEAIDEWWDVPRTGVRRR